MAKLEMIQECENLLPNWWINKYKSLFPRFIIVRRLRQDDHQINIDQQQLMVKQISHNLQEEMSYMDDKFSGTQSQFNSSITERMDRIESLIKKHDDTERMDRIETLIKKLDEKLDK